MTFRPYMHGREKMFCVHDISFRSNEEVNSILQYYLDSTRKKKQLVSKFTRAIRFIGEDTNKPYPIIQFEHIRGQDNESAHHHLLYSLWRLSSKTQLCRPLFVD